MGHGGRGYASSGPWGMGHKGGGQNLRVQPKLHTLCVCPNYVDRTGSLFLMLPEARFPLLHPSPLSPGGGLHPLIFISQALVISFLPPNFPSPLLSLTMLTGLQSLEDSFKTSGGDLGKASQLGKLPEKVQTRKEGSQVGQRCGEELERDPTVSSDPMRRHGNPAGNGCVGV